MRYLLLVLLFSFYSALAQNKNYLAGLNIYRGRITHKGVADAFKMQYYPPDKVLSP